MVYIYVLELAHGKYYVGKTNNPQFRLENHFSSNGSEWTKIYKPLNVFELIPNCDDYDEDKITRKYMDKYGINNVRGGSFVSVNLDNSTLEVLNKMRNGTNNKCFTCGKEGHFSNNCFKRLNKNNFINYTNKVVDYNNYESDEDINYCKKLTNNKKTKNNSKQTFVNKCFRCGREGHCSTNCYATTHIKGYYIT